MGDSLKKKAKRGFDPRSAYGEPAVTGTKSTPSIGPKAQIIKLDQSVKGRGTGTIGASIGARPKKALKRGPSNIHAGRRSRNR